MLFFTRLFLIDSIGLAGVQHAWFVKTDSLGFDGVTDFVSDTTYRIEYIRDTCYNDTVVAYVNMYGVTAPYNITYGSITTHNNLYYSPMYEPYVSDSLILTPSTLSGNDTVIEIICQITDGIGRVLTDTISVNVACLVSVKNIISKENIIKIYPNPANDNIIVKYALIEEWSEGKIEIYDLQGKLMLSLPIEKQFDVKTIDVSGIPIGNYLITVGNKGLKGYTKQISVVHR